MEFVFSNFHDLTLVIETFREKFRWLVIRRYEAFNWKGEGSNSISPFSPLINSICSYRINQMTTIFFRFTHFANCILHLVINTTPFFFILDIITNLRSSKLSIAITLRSNYNFIYFPRKKKRENWNIKSNQNSIEEKSSSCIEWNIFQTSDM